MGNSASQGDGEAGRHQDCPIERCQKGYSPSAMDPTTRTPQASQAARGRGLHDKLRRKLVGAPVRGQRNSPGGYNLGDIGPSAEGMAAFVVGMVALVAITVWLGAKS